MNLAPIARATSLRDLLKACAGVSGCSPWVLVHPLAEPVFHDIVGSHPVDPLGAGQIALIPFAGNDAVTCGVESPWVTRLVDLLSFQFPAVSATMATMMIWGPGDLVAIIGIATTDHSLEEVRRIADEAAHSLKRIHENELLRQQLAALRHISLNLRESILIVRADGKIEQATASGWDALHAYMRRRPSKKDPVIEVPASMKEALRCSKKTTLRKVAMSVYNLPGDHDTLLPLRVVFMEATQTVSADSLEDRIATLTPSQRAAYNLVIGGYRNKEIATELGISYNTAIHHVAAMLSKMMCGDRLQLMAAARGMPRKVLAVPDLITVPPVADLPIPVKFQR